MSRREGRDSHSKRLTSRAERETSPKRQRRDGKPATERIYSSNYNSGIVEPTSRDQKQHRRLQEALPLEAPVESEPKTWLGSVDAVNREADKDNELPDGSKYSSNPTEVPRSRSYYQHDERGSAGQGVRSFNQRNNERTRWSDKKDRSSDRVGDKMVAYDATKRDEKNQGRTDDNSIWRHDGFFELEAEAPPVKKRPAFREKKVLPETETTDAVVTDSVRNSRPDRNMKRDERVSGYYNHGLEKSENPSMELDGRNAKTGDRPVQKGESQRGSFPTRDRFGSGGGFRGRERFSGRYGGKQSGGFQVEKWKHDMFDEANRSPTPKNEDDQIAKVEALLAL